MKVVVEIDVGEHQCCGDAIELSQLVDLPCTRWQDSDGRIRLLEAFHGIPVETRARGRVTDLAAVFDDGSSLPIARVPGGAALRGFDEHDDGHLEAPWTGELIDGVGRAFLVTVKL